MSRTLTLEIPDELFAALERMARLTREPVETLAVSWLARHALKVHGGLDETAAQEAWGRIEKYAGVIDSDDPQSGDNERIDADLARVYMNSGETES